MNSPKMAYNLRTWQLIKAGVLTVTLKEAEEWDLEDEEHFIGFSAGEQELRRREMEKIKRESQMKNFRKSFYG